MPVQDEEQARLLVDGIRLLADHRRENIQIVKCSVIEKSGDGQFLKLLFRRRSGTPGILTETVFLKISDPIPNSLESLGRFMDSPSVLAKGTPASDAFDGECVVVEKVARQTAT